MKAKSVKASDRGLMQDDHSALMFSGILRNVSSKL